ncbi:MAG: T9SS type A sorting domain-containing protein, partial [Bacteroidia bacterium]
AQYGTPFDLTDLQGTAGLDINHITHVKIIDVVGSITTPYATFDINNNKVNDPWPTPFASSGFDLDAVGVINQQTTGINQLSVNSNQLIVYPNPASNYVAISLNKTTHDNTSVFISDVNGKIILQQNIFSTESMVTIDVSALENGFYFLQIKDNTTCITKKISIVK